MHCHPLRQEACVPFILPLGTYGHLFRCQRPCVVCIMTAVICAHLTRPFEYGHMHAH
ncbi:hypothetical protein [Rock bream iridovirus]|uniref:Uncharacterized protein n=1 Tax=Rock bream iridovirus TaxID=263891 RepID=M1SQM7_ISKNV|nr:hypothetical protein [Rock bream iridovirus]